MNTNDFDAAMTEAGAAERLQGIKGKWINARAYYGEEHVGRPRLDVVRRGYVDLAEPGAEFFAPHYLSYGDYHGSSVTEANVRTWRERFADGDQVWWTERSEAHGTHLIIITASAIPDAALDVLRELEDYPIIDENELSEVEQEREDAAWSNWVWRDYWKALEKAGIVSEDAEHPERSALWAVFSAAMDRSNTYWSHEAGDVCTIDVARVVAGTEASDIPEAWRPVEVAS